jgi:hypothetical protein
MTSATSLSEAELAAVGVDRDWLDDFVRESNLLDPQPSCEPGQAGYDLHMEAVLYAVRCAVADCFALPREVHRILLPDHPFGGIDREQPFRMGFRMMLQPHRVPYYCWRWNCDARERIGALRTRRRDAVAWQRQQEIWDLHCELMNIRPFELYNGRVGRALMVNHAILAGEDPWIVPFSSRALYVSTIQQHPSADWVYQPLYRPDPGAVRYTDWRRV